MDNATPTLDVSPIDRTHLKQMTLGDNVLAREVLTLFDRQAAVMIERMRDADGAGQAAMAHALKGSARGIGAWQVAEAAALFDRAPTDAPGAAALTALAAAVAQARSEIARIIRQS
jgi:hypothetical protein